LARWKNNGYKNDYPENYMSEIRKMKTWLNNRISWLNTELNKVEILPKNKTFASKVSGYSEVASQTFTLVAYGDIVKLSATLQKADLSAFAISVESRKTATGNGGYLASINVKPKNSLPTATYNDTLIFRGENQGYAFTIKVTLDFAVITTETAVLTSDRIIPSLPDKEAGMATPVNACPADFTVGPNPAYRPFGTIGFFRRGSRVADAKLHVYDALGNAVSLIALRDDAPASPQSKRRVGSWNLTDNKGHPVPHGTYLLKGVIKTSDGKNEKVSLIVGVR
jgi:hypothetical protein